MTNGREFVIVRTDEEGLLTDTGYTASALVDDLEPDLSARDNGRLSRWITQAVKGSFVELGDDDESQASIVVFCQYDHTDR